MQHLLITGASAGIGEAFCLKAIQAGYRLSLTARDSSRLSQLWQQIPPAQRGICQAVDLQDSAALRDFCLQLQLCRDSATGLGCPVDSLILCAGINSSRQPAHTPEYRALEQMLAVNFMANVRLLEALLPSMQQRSAQGASCSVMALLSTCCLFANPHLSGYSASKAALDSYLKVLRKEQAEHGVRVLSVYPGGVNTGFRPNPRPDYLAPMDVADAMLAMLQAPQHAHWHELVLRPAVERNYA